jgi:site-specific recombinase XerD
MAGCLSRLAKMILNLDKHPDGRKITGTDVPWWNLTYDVTVALRARMDAEGWAPATINKYMSAIRGVAEQSWRLGLMNSETRDRIKAVAGSKGTRLPAGRQVPEAERDALLAACDDGTPKGTRDAAVIALMYATGARRAELASLDISGWSPSARQFRVIGKRNKERILPVSTEAVPLLTAWLRVRGPSPGPVFCPVRKNGAIAIARLTGQTMLDIVKERSKHAGLRHGEAPSPHDFRRTVVGDLLDEGADLATVQRIAGHSSPATTARYDRRPDAAMLAAVDKLHIRQPKGDGN